MAHVRTLVLLQLQNWVICSGTCWDTDISTIQWLDLWENLQETIDVPMKIMGFSCNCSLKPINRTMLSIFLGYVEHTAIVNGKIPGITA